MGFWSSVLGTSGVAESVRDGIDKVILTDEERLDYQKELLKAYEPFKLIQRFLAISITAMFAFIMMLQICLIIAGHWNETFSIMAKDINDLESVAMVGYSFMSVISLFFLGGTINSYVTKFNK